MTKSKYKIIKYGVIALAGVALLVLAWWLLAKLFGGVGALLALFGLGGAGRKLLKDYQAEETKAAAAIEAVDTTHQATHDALEEQAHDEQSVADEQAQEKQDATAAAVDDAETSEDLDAIAKADRAKAAEDRKAWAELTTPNDKGFVRVLFCAVLVVVTLLGMVVGHMAHGAPLTKAEKARTKALLLSLQQCTQGGNKLARVLVKERKQHAAALQACKKKRKIDNAKHVKQKAILIKQKPPLISAPVLAGVVIVVALAAAGGLGLGWYLRGRQVPK